MADLLQVGAALQQAQQDALTGQPDAARRLGSTSAQLRGAITRLIGRAETRLSGHEGDTAKAVQFRRVPLCVKQRAAGRGTVSKSRLTCCPAATRRDPGNGPFTAGGPVAEASSSARCQGD
jgi:hypothetical protein